MNLLLYLVLEAQKRSIRTRGAAVLKVVELMLEPRDMQKRYRGASCIYRGGFARLYTARRTARGLKSIICSQIFTAFVSRKYVVKPTVPCRVTPSEIEKNKCCITGYVTKKRTLRTETYF